MTDDALVRQYAARRDAEAFRQLVEKYSDLVYTTCLRVTGNPHDAENAAQECFLALARKAGSISTSPAGWLHATAQNASLAVAQDTFSLVVASAAKLLGEEFRVEICGRGIPARKTEDGVRAVDGDKPIDPAGDARFPLNSRPPPLYLE